MCHFQTSIVICLRALRLRAISCIVVGMSRGLFSVMEAANKLGISDSHCRRLLAKGEINGKKLGHDWVVLRLDYKRRRKPKREKTE